MSKSQIDLIKKFNNDMLFIDISTDENPDIWTDCEELGELLDEYDAIKPHNGETWRNYISTRIDEWRYIRVHYSDSLRRNVGTASDQDPETREVLTTKEFIELLSESIAEPNTEDFDSLFD